MCTVKLCVNYQMYEIIYILKNAQNTYVVNYRYSATLKFSAMKVLLFWNVLLLLAYSLLLPPACKNFVFALAQRVSFDILTWTLLLSVGLEVPEFLVSLKLLNSSLFLSFRLTKQIFASYFYHRVEPNDESLQTDLNSVCFYRTTPKPWGCSWGSRCGKLTTGLLMNLRFARSTLPLCRDRERELQHHTTATSKWIPSNHCVEENKDFSFD